MNFCSDLFIFLLSNKIKGMFLWTECTLYPEKKVPPPQVKYSNTHNTEQKSLKMTEHTDIHLNIVC